MNNPETTPNNEVEAVEEMNFLQRVIGIIISPVETMKKLTATPRLLSPILLMLLTLPIYSLLHFSLYKKTFIQSAVEAAIAQQGLTVTASQMARMVNISAIIGLVSSTMSVLFSWLIIAAVIFAFVKIFKGQGTFKQYLSITGYAYVISAISLVLSSILSLFTGQLFMDASLANITNLFAPNIKGTFLYGVIRGFDVFSIWYYAVIAVGVAGLSQLRKGVVYTLLTVIFFATLLLGATSIKGF